jgi:hypothetical protein
MDRYCSLVHQQSATPEIWVSLYEIAKIRPAAANFQVDVLRTSLGDLEETVQVLKTCGRRAYMTSDVARVLKMRSR